MFDVVRTRSLIRHCKSKMCCDALFLVFCFNDVFHSQRHPWCAFSCFNFLCFYFWGNQLVKFMLRVRFLLKVWVGESSFISREPKYPPYSFPPCFLSRSVWPSPFLSRLCWYSSPTKPYLSKSSHCVMKKESSCFWMFTAFQRVLRFLRFYFSCELNEFFHVAFYDAKRSRIQTAYDPNGFDHRFFPLWGFLRGAVAGSK